MAHEPRRPPEPMGDTARNMGKSARNLGRQARQVRRHGGRGSRIGLVLIVAGGLLLVAAIVGAIAVNL